MSLHFHKSKQLSLTALIVRDRYLLPTETAISSMVKSLEAEGQITPIVVRGMTLNSYRLVAGATRFEAAKLLGWKTIRADIITVDHEVEYAMIELRENLDRRGLTEFQRKQMKQKLVEYQKEILAGVEPSKGGRGNKGGMADAAREAGMPRATAQRRSAKGAHNTENGHVSEDAKPTKTKSNGDAATSAAEPPAKTTSKLELRKLSFDLTSAPARCAR